MTTCFESRSATSDGPADHFSEPCHGQKTSVSLFEPGLNHPHLLRRIPLEEDTQNEAIQIGNCWTRCRPPCHNGTLD